MKHPVFLMRRAALPVLALGLSLAASQAFAHGGEMHDDEDVPGSTYTVNAGIGWVATSAQAAFPVRTPGLLVPGSAPADERGSALDYAEATVLARWGAQWQGQLSVHKHGSEGVSEVDTAWVQYRVDSSAVALTGLVGRQAVALGLAQKTHSHQRLFGIAPMVEAAVTGDGWTADGVAVNAAWGSGLSAHLGLWQDTPWVPKDSGALDTVDAAVQWKQGGLQLGFSAMAVPAHQRASVFNTTGAGHTHAAPSCQPMTTNVVCFTGTTEAYVAALRWQASTDWWVASEYWLQRDKGQLSSTWGTPQYTGDTSGAWVELGWQASPTVRVAARSNVAQAAHGVYGANAQLVADQAHIADASRVLYGHGLAADWRVHPNHRLAVEWYRDPSGADFNNVWKLRYQIDLAKAW